MAGAISPGEVKEILSELEFNEINITPKDQSEKIIQGWNVGQGAEKVVFSAYIQAVKPMKKREIHMKLKIEPFSVEDEKEVLGLLSVFELPTEDLTTDKLKDFIVTRQEDGLIIGAVGIEAYQDVGLLRSLVVHPNHQAKGLGRFLTYELESLARKKGIKALYLLTTTAADFFLKLEYQFVQKTTVPDSIKSTEEFKSICPESAVCLYKYLEST